jgi:hypothetical protein
MSFRRIRMWLVAGLVLPVLLVLTPARAQVGFRGGINGGMAGRPGGINGGMAGRPGGIGGMPGGGLQQTEWVCGGCGKVLGRGPVKPVLTQCPFCGVKFTNGLDFEMSGPGGFGPRGPVGPPAGGIGGVGGPPAGNPPMGMGGGANIPPTDPGPPQQPPPVNPPDAPAANNNNNNVPPPAAADAAPANSGGSKTTRIVLIVGAIGCGVLLLFAALGTFLYLSAARSGKDASPKRRRKRVYHDEDADDD